MESIKKYIYEQVASQKLSPKDAKLLLEEYEGKKQETDDIAIIGMSGKFPGAKNLEEYWQILKDGKNCFTNYPQSRIDHYIDSINIPFFFEFITGVDLEEDEKVEFSPMVGGYIDDIDKFDAAFFKISPKEAKYMNPEQRVFLESAWETIEDAGYNANRISGTKTGIYVGIDKSNTTIYKHLTKQDSMHLTGSWSGILASRLAYLYDLKGPCLVIDTACSSGLVALHLACQSLKSKECEMAIAGGIQLTELGLEPKNGKGDGTLKVVESTDNVLRSFEKHSNGTVWGEGIGTVLLKPLKKALEDGDNIHAIIKGSAMNNDGVSNSITTPNAEAQEEVIVSAWEDSGISPETISYMEAHGTGTMLGDPIEIKGITNAFARYTDKMQFCGIGSVKPNVGHAVGASGFASLFKVILSMKNEVIPPTINFNDPNPYINFCESPVFVNDKLREWKKGDSPRRAGTSAFGFSGTNCHVVVEEMPLIKREALPDGNPQVVSISAKSRKVLENLVSNYIGFIDDKAVRFNMSLEDISFTANTGRGHYTYRLALIVKDVVQLKEKLVKFLNGSCLESEGIYYGEHNVVSETRKVREENELTEKIIHKLSENADTEIKRLLNAKGTDEETLAVVCRYYIKGAEINWEELYNGRKPRRVSIPTYPFERVECHAEPRCFSKTRADSENEILHPLIDKCLADSMESMIFTTKFSPERHWVLSEHRFAKMCLIPGVTYIEMIREACSRYFNSSCIELNDLIFMAPIIVEEGEEKEAQTIIKKFTDYVEFMIVTKDESDEFEKNGKWVVHVKGTAKIISHEENEVFDIEEIEGNCKTDMGRVSLEIENPPEDKAIGKFEFGPRWNSMPRKLIGEAFEFISVQLSSEFSKDLEGLYLHPSMLDCACNAPMFTNVSGIYLPFLFKSIKILGQMPNKFYSYIQKKNSGSGETLESDITLMEADGKPFMKITGYSAKKVHMSQQRKLRDDKNAINNFFGMNWVSCELDCSQTSGETGNVIVIKGQNDVCSDVIRKIAGSGNTVIEVEYGAGYENLGQNKYKISGSSEDFLKILNEAAKGQVRQIVHMATLNGAKEITDIREINASLEIGVYSLFNMVKALLESKRNADTDIVLISDYANEVTGAEKRINPHNAAFFGLGKVVGQEYSNLKCRCIDIDDETDSSSIVSELNAAYSSKKVALRNNNRYVEELARIRKDSIEGKDFEIKETGIYIITGGTGGIGLEIAKYLAGKKCVNLALLNRSKLPSRSEWDSILEKGEDKKLCSKLRILSEIEKKGSKVECISTDVSNEADLKAVIDSLKERYSRINGIVHAAGIAGDSFIMNKDKGTFGKVLLPKVQGTWLLDKLTEDMDIDMFVLFSSMTALLGGPGQGDYTAANGYLDSFSEYRNKLGKKTIAINWPGWKETGMAVDFGVNMQDTLFKSISTASAIDTFDFCLGTELKRVLPAEFNYNFSLDFFGINCSDEIQRAFERGRTKSSSVNNKNQEMNIEDIKIKGKGESGYTPTETKLAYICANVFSINEIDIYQEFDDLGIDSLLAAQLFGSIEKQYDKLISFGDIFTYSSVQMMAEYIDMKRAEEMK